MPFYTRVIETSSNSRILSLILCLFALSGLAFAIFGCSSTASVITNFPLSAVPATIAMTPEPGPSKSP